MRTKREYPRRYADTSTGNTAFPIIHASPKAMHKSYGDFRLPRPLWNGNLKAGPPKNLAVRWRRRNPSTGREQFLPKIVRNVQLLEKLPVLDRLCGRVATDGKFQ